MKSHNARNWAKGGVTMLGLLALAGSIGCGLDKVKVPPLFGPSELGLSLQMTASPDIVHADGVSQSVITITARDENGRPAPNRAIFVTGIGDGTLIAGSVLVGPLATGFTVQTASNGVAVVVYQSGLSITTIIIQARPYGFDAYAGLTRTVAIDQR